MKTQSAQRRANIGVAATVLSVWVGSYRAQAQEAMDTQAPTMASPGTFILRPQFHYSAYGSDPTRGTSQTERYQVTVGLQYGIARDWSVDLRLPVVFQRDTDETTDAETSDEGVEDLDLTVKYRFLKQDTGPLDTFRMAVFGGARVASGDSEEFSSGSVNPYLGITAMLIRGRHGFGQDLSYQLNTGGAASNFGGMGDADALRYDTSYLFRLSPAEYSEDTYGSLYAVGVLSGLYETNGDHEVVASPGLMFEAREWAIELMLRLPAWQDVEERAELDWGLGVGVRLSF